MSKVQGWARGKHEILVTAAGRSTRRPTRRFGHIGIVLATIHRLENVSKRETRYKASIQKHRSFNRFFERTRNGIPSHSSAQKVPNGFAKGSLRCRNMHQEIEEKTRRPTCTILFRNRAIPHAVREDDTHRLFYLNRRHTLVYIRLSTTKIVHLRVIGTQHSVMIQLGVPSDNVSW